MNRGFRLIATAALATVIAAPAAAQSTLLTSNAGYTGPGLDLSAYANGSYNFTFGPRSVSGFTFTAAPGGGGNSGNGSVIGQGSYGLGANGNFGGTATYIGVDSATGYAQLLGTTGYSQIGFFMNYDPGVGNPATISTLDAGGNVIASFNLEALAPISTPNGVNQFQFRGVSSTLANSIYGLRFGGDYILVTGTASGAVASVPETATWAMMLIGFGMAGFALRRRVRASEVRFDARIKRISEGAEA